MLRRPPPALLPPPRPHGWAAKNDAVQWRGKWRSQSPGHDFIGRLANALGAARRNRVGILDENGFHLRQIHGARDAIGVEVQVRDFAVLVFDFFVQPKTRPHRHAPEKFSLHHLPIDQRQESACFLKCLATVLGTLAVGFLLLYASRQLGVSSSLQASNVENVIYGDQFFKPVAAVKI